MKKTTKKKNRDYKHKIPNMYRFLKTHKPNTPM